jgi:hypothetical protein
MPLAQVAAFNHVYAQAPMFQQQSLRGTTSMKRNVEADQDFATPVIPKIRRTAVMHNVHDVGSALLSLSLSANPTPTTAATKSQSMAPPCNADFTHTADCEPELGTIESDRITYSQPGSSLIGDEEDLYDRNQYSDQGMLMDPAMFADRISACSRITVAENTLASVSQVLSPSSKGFFEEKIHGPIDGGCGALIVYRFVLIWHPQYFGVSCDFRPFLSLRSL